MTERPTPDTSPTTRFAVLLSDLHRVVDRRMARDFPHPKPPENQLALLRLVGGREGITVREAADVLLMQPTNVSTLVSQLVEAGLLTRVQDDQDRRVAHLHVTDEARARIERADAAMGDVLAEGLRRVDPAQADAVLRALPALAALLDALG
ncbi:MarR family winged helix-turn-helix transcriptional regulator [Saccharothrix longispora]|uniref:MarR family winged helix-turn-helix transcriptional regulator n=1 Tax=Saccharothrix longispora TaxID=33920 RepID=UPI0028FD3E78|nr:MarR family transcriptional regulator [Saccharothrix longispora]MBY8849610.1 MarR family transcriptional regulator [Saccharothrix sp. MB29]MDU0288360.1 MarR family transcriptional regulator [Saccharothrix longispora]